MKSSVVLGRNVLSSFDLKLKCESVNIVEETLQILNIDVTCESDEIADELIIHEEITNKTSNNLIQMFREEFFFPGRPH